MESDRETVLIGFSEYIDLPEWGIRNLRAKIDTGARTSALDVEDIQEISPGRVSFEVIVRRRSNRRLRIEAAIVRRGPVRSSTGATTERLFVETTLRLGPVERRVELSLVHRGLMTHRAILGRTSLDECFRIDASRRNVLGRRRRRPRSPSSPAEIS